MHLAPFRNRVRFRPSLCGMEGVRHVIQRFSDSEGMQLVQLNPGGYATRKVVGESVRLVACEVTWYLKYQVMLPDGRQTYDQVYASLYSSSYKFFSSSSIVVVR